MLSCAISAMMVLHVGGLLQENVFGFLG